ncbi:MAG: hypothetical protein L0271_13440 [Gemmatimonadetes bacterium]|nr:hypothetical protein [Gemmatimonadota bacterium]
MRGLLAWRVLVLAIGGLIACRAERTQVIDRDTFVDVMVALRREAVATLDSLAFDARREEILASAGVTDSALFAFVRAMEREPAGMAEIWDDIDARVNAPPAEDADTARVR